MKKTISLMLCLLLIFSSVNFIFAAEWTTTDQNNLQSIKNSVNLGGALYDIVNSINQGVYYGGWGSARWLNQIQYDLSTYLKQSDGTQSRTIAWWLKEAVNDLDVLAGTGTGSLYMLLLEILNAQTYYTPGGNARQSWLQKLDNDLINNGNTLTTIKTNAQAIAEDVETIKAVNTANLPNIKTFTGNLSDDFRALYTNYGYTIGANGNLTSNTATQYKFTTALIDALNTIKSNIAQNYQYQFLYLANQYNWDTNWTDWNDLSSKSFRPASVADGTFKLLRYIQTPIARLAYVHASDEEIEAREKSASNQEAVVDNFIDSTGSGAAPASSFGNVASMSAGYTSNMNTNASASGIWNIFNSNNFGWFSQETANQLDTTVSTRRGSSDFETPLLDQQIADIYKELGVDIND